MAHGNFYKDVLGADYSAYMHKRVKELDPDVKIAVNDFNVLTPQGGWDGVIEKYMANIKDLVNRGAPIDIVAVQGHYADEQTIDVTNVYRRLDRLTTNLNLPIWITEFDIEFADEQERADNLENLYRIAFSHPNVEGILMWGFWADRHWRDDHAAIVDKDWTVNAAGRRYQQIRQEWRTEESKSTNSSGVASFRAFHGEFDVEITLAGGQKVNSNFYLEPGDSTLQVEINTADNGVTTSSSSSAQPSSSSTSTANLGDGVAYPNSSQPATIPGVVEAENFNQGTNNQAYYDSDAAVTIDDFNHSFRKDTLVDIKTDPNESDYIIGYFREGEWLKYTINVTEPGLYRIRAKAHSASAGRQLQLQLAGQNLVTLDVPQVATWNDEAFTTSVVAELPAGVNTLRLELLNDNNADLDYLEFELLESISVQACLGDYNNDLTVNEQDYAIFEQEYKTVLNQCQYDLVGDDCLLNAADLSAFAGQYLNPNACNQ